VGKWGLPCCERVSPAQKIKKSMPKRHSVRKNGKICNPKKEQKEAVLAKKRGEGGKKFIHLRVDKKGRESPWPLDRVRLRKNLLADSEKEIEVSTRFPRKKRLD